MPARVGLTGGIGSGKTTVANLFRARGVAVFCADDIGRELTAPGEPAYKEIVDCFGKNIVGADGYLNRKKLGEIVFSHAGRRKQLEEILHPPIRQVMSARADAAPGAYCILDIPLLIETAQNFELQRVLVVECARELRIARLRQRGMDAATAARIMQTQTTDARRAAYADDIMRNAGGEHELRAQVEKLHLRYLNLFAKN